MRSYNRKIRYLYTCNKRKKVTFYLNNLRTVIELNWTIFQPGIGIRLLKDKRIVARVDSEGLNLSFFLRNCKYEFLYQRFHEQDQKDTSQFAPVCDASIIFTWANEKIEIFKIKFRNRIYCSLRLYMDCTKVLCGLYLVFTRYLP